MRTWLELPPATDFPLENLPYGIFAPPGKRARVGVAIGQWVLDLKRLAKQGLFNDLKIDGRVFAKPSLNAFIGLGRAAHQAVRARLQEFLTSPPAKIAKRGRDLLLEQSQVQLFLPVKIGDYTDFYSSLEHATNVGKMFRGEANALLPNWKHLPVAYHGRSSSIVVSGTPLARPWGQTSPGEQAAPSFGPSRAVDFELEVAFIIGKENPLGQPVPAAEAEDYVFGFVLFNDWSARDLQKWEYQPLGPFLGKNFGSTISPWVVTLDALAPFRTTGPGQDPPVLPYLQTAGPRTFDLELSVAIQAAQGPATVVCRSNFKHLYWNISQQIAHHTVNGCNLKIGDLLASGTISGPEPTSFGSLQELTWGGKNPLTLANGSQRRFLEDGDTVILNGWAEKDGLRIGFGPASGQLLPARPQPA
ncbi:MAG: fumarylacetoacetase [Bernardetiaceae bacterium]|jgi:fumarylacetoacetase|nr:fumarylacetoacetase [Bernardetiaceae bacterium]